VPLNAFPWVINGMMEAWVSLKRLQRYMNLNSVCWTQYYTTSELTGTLHFTVSVSSWSSRWCTNSWTQKINSLMGNLAHSNDRCKFLWVSTLCVSNTCCWQSCKGSRTVISRSNDKCVTYQWDHFTFGKLTLSLLQAGCPSCRPTNSVKALKASSER